MTNERAAQPRISDAKGPRPRSRLHRLLAALAVGIPSLLIGGCGSQPTYVFDELDLTPTQDELTEFSLGHYAIPIPVVPSYRQNGGPAQNLLEFSFDLHALITSDYESQLDQLWERHQRMTRDRIILVCRNATLEELQEPELSTLKSHLTDAVQAELGSKDIRRLLMTEVNRVKL